MNAPNASILLALYSYGEPRQLTGVLNVYWRRYALVDYSSAGVCVVNYSLNQRDLCALGVTNVPVRIQGGNWKMQGFRRSSHGHEEVECQMSIAEFMIEQGMPCDSDAV